MIDAEGCAYPWSLKTADDTGNTIEFSFKQCSEKSFQPIKYLRTGLNKMSNLDTDNDDGDSVNSDSNNNNSNDSENDNSNNNVNSDNSDSNNNNSNDSENDNSDSNNGNSDSSGNSEYSAPYAKGYVINNPDYKPEPITNIETYQDRINKWLEKEPKWASQKSDYPWSGIINNQISQKMYIRTFGVSLINYKIYYIIECKVGNKHISGIKCIDDFPNTTKGLIARDVNHFGRFGGDVNELFERIKYVCIHVLVCIYTYTSIYMSILFINVVIKPRNFDNCDVDYGN